MNTLKNAIYFQCTLGNNWYTNQFISFAHHLYAACDANFTLTTWDIFLHKLKPSEEVWLDMITFKLKFIINIVIVVTITVVIVTHHF